MDEPQEGTHEENLSLQLQTLIMALAAEAEDRVRKRNVIEERWLEDLQNYHGRYEDKVLNDLTEQKKSTLFINLTRAKTNSMEARLSDMLFPTDDRNWGIEPTPVPELTVQAEQAANQLAEAQLNVAADPENPETQAQADEASSLNAQIQAILEEARQRARSMEEEIDDHLRETNYAAEARDVIRDGCKLGTGVFKGPVSGGHYKRKWVLEQDQNTYQIVYGTNQKPMFWRVDPWNFYPDMDATNMDENEQVFERHLLNKKQLRKLARQPNFDRDAIREILMEEPREQSPNYITQLRSITGGYSDSLKDRYHVWEWHGCIEAKDLEMIAEATGNMNDMMAEVRGEDGEMMFDPLDELNVVLWFCHDKLLNIGIHQLDSGEPIYSVFNLEKDEASMFGFGIPYIMRDPQSALAAAWRALMDNMGLSAGPQIVINDDVLEPVDGDWHITPRKLWKRKGAATPDKKPFETFDIPANTEALIAAINLTKQNIDEETSMPMIAQGEQGAQVTKTAQGMGILMNSVNVVFRRIVKNWDDQITTRNLRRLYDWLMQFSPKDNIKGDMQVDARGSSVLLVREIQSANMMQFAMSFVGHPQLGRYIKRDGVPLLRQVAKTMMIPVNEVVKSEAEIKADDAAAAQQPPPPDPEMEKLSVMLQIEQMKGEFALNLEGMRRETALIKLAQQQNMQLEELSAKLNDSREERTTKERIMATEAAITERQAANGQQKGSGGYF